MGNNTIYTGSDVAFGLTTVQTKRTESIEIELMRDKFTATPSDPIAVERGSGPPDCKITITGQDSDDPGALSAADLMALVLSGAPPESLYWTDKATTPASKFPANFFTIFPLNKWRVDSVTGGNGGATDVGKWKAQLTPNNQNLG